MSIAFPMACARESAPQRWLRIDLPPESLSEFEEGKYLNECK